MSVVIRRSPLGLAIAATAAAVALSGCATFTNTDVLAQSGDDDITNDDFEPVAEEYFANPEVFGTTPVDGGRANAEQSRILLGVMVPAPSARGYVHLVGIHPDHRRRAVGKRLYEQFTERCRAAGMKQIKSLAAAGHEGPMRFHESMGFESTEVPDYAGPGRSRVVFVKEL